MQMPKSQNPLDCDVVQAIAAMRESDTYSRHEVLHTAHVLSDLFDRHIARHQFTLAHPELAKAADDIGAALADFYQAVGNTVPDSGQA